MHLSTFGFTTWVDFDTARSVYPTAPGKCYVSQVVCDTESWEQKITQVLEDMPEVLAYVKNQNLGFYIPYSTRGDERRYVPDFIARVATDVGGPNGGVCRAGRRAQPCARGVRRGQEGEGRQGRLGPVDVDPGCEQPRRLQTMGFLEISDPWDAANTIRACLRTLTGEGT